MKINQFLPKQHSNINIEEIFNSHNFSNRQLLPFSDIIIDFLADISNAILKNTNASKLPELIALAYWLRKSNIKSIIKVFLNTKQNNHVIVPRGIAFHITPSNVDTMFMYSWTISLLAANSNIIKISQNVSNQMNVLLDIIKSVINQEEYKIIAQTNIIINYPHDDSINLFFSQNSDIRIIWGGDNTIQTIRNNLAKPTTKDIVFADKISYSAINSTQYINLDEAKSDELAHKFFNDAYYYNQLGCSSPRIVYFIGNSQDCISASNKFWNTFNQYLTNHNHNEDASVLMNKLSEMYEQAAKGIQYQYNELPHSGNAVVLNINSASISNCRVSCGGGFFYECFLNNILNLSDLVMANDQTLSYFGFSSDELNKFVVQLNGKAIDRIVPIGNALSFSTYWDGYELLSEVTKIVVIE